MKFKAFGFIVDIHRADTLAGQVMKLALEHFGGDTKIPLIKAVRYLNLVKDHSDGTTSLYGAKVWVESHFDFSRINAREK